MLLYHQSLLDGGVVGQKYYADIGTEEPRDVADLKDTSYEWSSFK